MFEMVLQAFQARSGFINKNNIFAKNERIMVLYIVYWYEIDK
jgi:hypothetical protein